MILKEKLKATALHLLISGLVISAFVTFILLYWYPETLAYISGLSSILIMLVAVDLIIGPFLTFVVYKKNKPKLLLDMTVITAIQVAALGYGAYALYADHPIYVTYSVDGYRVISAKDIDPQKSQYDYYKKSKLASPTLAYAKKPDDLTESSKITEDIMSGGPDIDFRPELYHPYKENLDEIFKRSISLETLRSTEYSKKLVDTFLKTNDNEKGFAFLPIEGKGKAAVWVINKETGNPVDILKIDPWSFAKLEPESVTSFLEPFRNVNKSQTHQN